jgi:hypothetical protein
MRFPETGVGKYVTLPRDIDLAARVQPAIHSGFDNSRTGGEIRERVDVVHGVVSIKDVKHYTAKPFS